jgi:hypothetical protein
MAGLSIGNRFSPSTGLSLGGRLSAGTGLYFGGFAFSPASLFAAGEQGVWYDPSDLTTLFQDSAGTTPVTAVEQFVGRMLDKSGRGNHATQSTDPARPRLSALVNLLTKTEQFDDGAWVKANVTVAANQTVAPDGTTTADLFYPSSSGTLRTIYNQDAISSGAGISYTSKFYLKRSGFRWAALDGFNTSYAAYFDLLNGVVGTVVAGHTATITAVGNDWYLCSVTTAASTGGAGYAAARLVDANGSQTATANGTDGLFVWGADLRVANDGVGLPVYQRVNTTTDYDTTGFPLYLRFDGTDDSMATGTITPGTDKVQAFSGVRKLSDSITGTVLQLSSSTSSNDGTLGMYAPFNTGAAADYAFISKGTVRVIIDSSAFVGPETTVLTGIGSISGPTAALSRNTVQIATSSSSQGTGNYLAYALNVGTGAGLLNGRVYSLIARFGANLTAQQISDTETWVNGKTLAYA